MAKRKRSTVLSRTWMKIMISNRAQDLLLVDMYIRHLLTKREVIWFYLFNKRLDALTSRFRLRNLAASIKRLMRRRRTP